MIWFKVMLYEKYIDPRGNFWETLVQANYINEAIDKAQKRSKVKYLSNAPLDVYSVWQLVSGST